jgi:hypothetical protein
MAPIKWNAPTIALTVNAILVGLTGLASLSGDDSALPPKFKTDNVHVVRALGHELFIMMCLMICGVVNNMAQKMCPYFGAGLLVSVWVHIKADDVSGGAMNFCIAMMHFYFGLVWKEKDAASKKE